MIPNLAGARSVDPPLDAQQLWFALRQHDWRSLALVAADAHCPTGLVARALADVASRHGPRPVRTLAAESLDLTTAAGLIAHLRALDAREAILIPLASPFLQPSAISLARAAGRAVLCVRREVTLLGDARGAIEAIGREHFLGYVVIDPAKS